MDEPGATVLEHRRIYAGIVFSIDKDRVRLPGGHEADVEVIRHAGSVVLLPMLSPREVVVIRQYRYSLDRWIWEIPAGRLENGERPEAAAVRECEEEIGLVPRTIERLGAFYPTPGFCDELMIFFRVSDLVAPGSDSTAKRDADEDLRVHRFTLDEVRELVRRGEIVDMKTAFGLELLMNAECGMRNAE